MITRAEVGLNLIYLIKYKTAKIKCNNILDNKWLINTNYGSLFDPQLVTKKLGIRPSPMDL